jgi:hypothetical protein
MIFAISRKSSAVERPIGVVVALHAERSLS